MRQEFIDFEVCQALLRLLNGVNAQLVAGFQFLRIKHSSGALFLRAPCQLFYGACRLQFSLLKRLRHGSSWQQTRGVCLTSSPSSAAQNMSSAILQSSPDAFSARCNLHILHVGAYFALLALLCKPGKETRSWRHSHWRCGDRTYPSACVGFFAPELWVL